MNFKIENLFRLQFEIIKFSAQMNKVKQNYFNLFEDCCLLPVI